MCFFLWVILCLPIYFLFVCVLFHSMVQYSHSNHIPAAAAAAETAATPSSHSHTWQAMICGIFKYWTMVMTKASHLRGVESNISKCKRFHKDRHFWRRQQQNDMFTAATTTPTPICKQKWKQRKKKKHQRFTEKHTQIHVAWFVNICSI